MRPRADAEKRLCAPVRQVVETLAPRLCPVRDLVVPVAGPVKRVLCELVHRGCQVRVRFHGPASVHVLVHRRARLKCERVERQVLRRVRQREIQRSLPTLCRLSWDAVHQVQAHVAKPGAARAFDGLRCLRRVVAASKRPQQFIVETLHADAQAIHSGVKIGG